MSDRGGLRTSLVRLYRAPAIFLRGGSTAFLAAEPVVPIPFPPAAPPPPIRPSISANISWYLPAVILPEAYSISGLADAMVPPWYSVSRRPAALRFDDGRPTKRFRWRCPLPGDATALLSDDAGTTPDDTLLAWVLPVAPPPTTARLLDPENLLVRVLCATGDGDIPKGSVSLAFSEWSPPPPPLPLPPPPPPLAPAPIAAGSEDGTSAEDLLLLRPKVSRLS